jgi:hypothetical protein
VKCVSLVVYFGGELSHPQKLQCQSFPQIGV